jgi:succinate dehydrogenase / fumarate reductase flavoprotein subunit
MIEHEVVIVGGGPAALAAAVAAGEAGGAAIVSKVHPLRFLSGEAQSDLAAALGRATEDGWQEHLRDTLEAGCGLCDEQAAASVTREAIGAVIALEHQGMLFARNAQGRIAQRALPGHKVARGCHYGDLTGKALIETLWGQTVRLGVRAYTDYYSLALLLHEDGLCGLMAWDLLHGGLVQFRAKAVVLAGGGMGDAWRTTSNPVWATGEALWLGARAGAALRDMEFVVFRPVLGGEVRLAISDAALGLGASLRTSEGERLLPQASSETSETAPPEVIAAAIAVAQERGLSVQVDFRHLDGAVVTAQLPRLCEAAARFFGADLARTPIPIRLGAHFLVGGLWVNAEGAAMTRDARPIPGLFAAGECASTGAHGASLLAGNALAEAVVTGARAGASARAHASQAQFASPPPAAVEAVEEQIREASERPRAEKSGVIRRETQEAMSAACGPLRCAQGLTHCAARLRSLRQALHQAGVPVGVERYNVPLVSLLETEQMLTVAEVVVTRALAREESRGLHQRTDCPERDEAGFGGHTLAALTEQAVQVAQAPLEKGAEAG